MDANEIKTKIDAIDDEIAALYLKRMSLESEIVKDSCRDVATTDGSLVDRATLNRVTADMPDEVKLYAKQVFDSIFNTAKAYRSRCVHLESKVKREIDEALAKGCPPFPVSASVACQGVAGSYAQIATDKMFGLSDILYFKDWNAVFNAVEGGLCEYGVLPIENSSVGSVNSVYDLMRKHNCYIVRSVRLRVQHYLLANAGTELKDIKEIYSHRQALEQCAEFIRGLKDVKVHVTENTASAARGVAESGRKDVACISSRDCAGIYGLKVIMPNIQDNENNYTRFIAISKELQVFEDSDKISIMVNLPHEAGSLNKLLNRFSTLGLNLTKLESRPIGNTDFEFAFYFDFEAKIARNEVRNLIAELDNECDRFVFLGSYREIM